MRERLSQLVELVQGYRFGSTDEVLIQDGLEQVLRRACEGFQREVHLCAYDRPDFLLADGVVVEVKVDGSLTALLRQLQRYAQHDQVRAILVVTNRSRLLDVPETLSGKPVAVASLLPGGLG